jgi:hypothetical protein
MGSVMEAGVDREVHATADQEVGATVLFLEVGATVLFLVDRRIQAN